MSSITDMLMGMMDSGSVSTLAGAIGANESQTKTAVGAAIPALMAALANNAADAKGAAALDGALERDHDGSILDGLGAVAGNAAMGQGILKHVLGSRQAPVAQGIAKASGLSSDQGSQLLAMVAPMVMGALGKAKRGSGLDAGGIASLLAGEKKQTMGQLGGLASLLDQDGDGSVVDDVLGGLGKKLFGG